MTHEYKVIVIGGGVSGLSACVKLIEANIKSKDILLIEANSHLGGRIRTIPFQNHVIELGAQWIHGTKNNPVYELLKSLNLVDQHKTDKSVIYSTPDGKEIDESYVEKILNKIENIFDNLPDFIENELEDDDSDQSLGTLINENFAKQILKKLKPNDNLELVKAIYRSRINLERNDNGCDDLRKLSAVGWNYYEDLSGDQYTNTKYGYGKLIEYLSSQIPSDSIKLNEVVEKIDWSSTKNQVTVLNRMENIRKVYECSYVLCTIPLGYLKEHHHNLFFPKLPLNKIKAIENLGFGCINKIFVVFEYPILKENIEGLEILWDLNNLKFDLELSNQKWNLPDSKVYQALDNFEVLPKMPNVLCCFVTGKDAKQIENIEDECLIDIIYQLLNKCFPKLNIPKPTRIIKSKWNQDNYTKGSYTYIKTGASINDVKSLQQDLSYQVFFAGEATNYKQIGTVHGAYNSGKDVANKIIKEIRQKNN